jgi:Rieske Fe-S protein
MTSTRRDFLKTLGIVTVCACAGMSGLSSCSMIKGVSGTEPIPDDAWQLQNNTITIDLNRSACLAEPGGAGKLSVNTGDEKPLKLIVLHRAAGKFKVFSDCCTHGGRELNYLHEEERLQCSSFGHSEFNLKGLAVKGPAEGPLAIYPCTKNGDLLNIALG